MKKVSIFIILLLLILVGCNDNNKNGEAMEAQAEQDDREDSIEDLEPIDQVSKLLVENQLNNAEETYYKYLNDLPEGEKKLFEAYLYLNNDLLERNLRDISQFQFEDEINKIEQALREIPQESRRTHKYLDKFMSEKAHPFKELFDTKKIAIGMTKQEVIISMGKPDKINTTTTSSSVSEQWVYPSEVYIYLEDGIVESYQY